MRMNKSILAIGSLFWVLFCLSVPLQAATYYVDTQGNDQNPGTLGQPWETISKANQNAAAGDIVYIRAGNYNTYIAPQRSGTAASPITFRNYADETVTISNAAYGVLLDGKSYIIIRGINFANLDKFLYIENNANHNQIAYCNFDQGRSIGWSGSKVNRSSKYNWIHHCRFTNYGQYTNEDIGSVLDIGDEESQTDLSNYNLIENNIMFHGGHHVLGLFGMYNVVRNNYFHNEAWMSGYGNRNIYVHGYPANSGWNLIEANRIGYSGRPPDNWGAPGMAVSSGYNIIRGNSFFFNDQCAIALTVTSNYYSDVVHNKIYNNSFHHNGWNMTNGPDVRTSAIGFSVYSGSHIVKYNALKNNIFHDHYQALGTYQVNLGDQTLAGNWDGKTQGDPQFLNASSSPGNPVDSSFPDLTLKPDSACIDAGTHLTTVTSGSGSGSSFQVADSRYFMNGWGIVGVAGDEIQLHGTNQKSRILSINYATHTISVDKTLSWTQNQGVSLSYQGNAPDIGAHEYSQANAAPSSPQNLRIIN